MKSPVFLNARRLRPGRILWPLVLALLALSPPLWAQGVVYQTPQAVLADYARKWRADPAMWRFLTGTQADVDRVAASFGMLYWPEGGQLVHTSSTGVLDRAGRLAALIEGSSYDAAQLGDLIDRQLKGE